MYKLIYTIILSTISLLFLFSCSEEKTPVTELSFNVDSTLLAPENKFDSLGFRFNPPKNFDPISDSLFTEIQNNLLKMEEESGKFSLDIINIFLHDSTKSFCSISRLQIKDSEGSLNSIMPQYRNYLEKKLSGLSVTMADFMKDNIHMYQFLIQGPDRIQFKLDFMTIKNIIIQIDYVVPKNDYEKMIQSIESSIGSIKLITQ
jgi:hypothetical protein